MAAKVRTIDFTNVKERGAFSKKHMPEGDYRAKVTKVEDAKSKDEGHPMWLFHVQLTGTPSATYPYYCRTDDPNQFWKIRNILVAGGLNVPKKALKVDPNKVVNKEIAVSLQDTEYNDRIQSEIGAIFSPQDLESDGPAEDDDGDEVEEDEAPEEKPKKGKKGKKSKSKKSKASDEVTDDELEELEVDDL